MRTVRLLSLIFVLILVGFGGAGAAGTTMERRFFVEQCQALGTPAAAKKNIDRTIRSVVASGKADSGRPYIYPSWYHLAKRDIITAQAISQSCPQLYAGLSDAELKILYANRSASKKSPPEAKKVIDKSSATITKHYEALFNRGQLKSALDRLNADEAPESARLNIELTQSMSIYTMYDAAKIKQYYKGKWYGYPIEKQYAALEAYAQSLIDKSGVDAAKVLNSGGSGMSASAAGSADGCTFAACTYGKKTCCRMAREQLGACESADSANQQNYSVFNDDLTNHARDSINECSHCARVWLKMNRC